MKTAIAMSYLTWKNAIDATGVKGYVIRIVFIPLLNILLLSTIFATAKSGYLTKEVLAYQYIYFIPLFSLSGAVSSWEIELFGNIGEEYLLRSAYLFSSRFFQILSECIISLLFFTFLLISVRASIYHFITLVLLFVTFSYSGIILGFCFGFRHEKAINNFLHSMTWVLGFGPGPFFNDKLEGYQMIFPGSFAIEGHFYLEWGKLLVYIIIFTILMKLFMKPRKQPLFSR